LQQDPVLSKAFWTTGNCFMRVHQSIVFDNDSSGKTSGAAAEHRRIDAAATIPAELRRTATAHLLVKNRGKRDSFDVERC
jgi:hypothetical protein